MYWLILLFRSLPAQYAALANRQELLTATISWRGSEKLKMSIALGQKYLIRYLFPQR